MIDNIKRFLIGKPLGNEEIEGQKYSIIWGLPILASDAISSVAYASEEILRVLVPVIALLAFSYLTYITAAIIILLFILIFSYRQTVHSYPGGGGSYIVASDNLGVLPGLTAGASLTVDYTLTVAVSISSATAAITSAFPMLLPYNVPICLLILVVMMIGNLRGIRESSRLFSFPTYAFIVAILIMIIVGIIEYFLGIKHPVEASTALVTQTKSLSVILILAAFSNGCAAITGVEAVSNSVPNFKEPQVKNAQKVLVLLAICVLVIFGGTSVLARLYQVTPAADKTVLSLIASQIFGHNFMYYFIQATTAIILAMAANTSYSGFPILLSMIAKNGYAPRQFSVRGDRLSYSNGIIALTVMAAVLIIVFKGSTTALIPLYAIGVFISFTLSQFGMFKKWLTDRGDHWVHKAVINGLGATVTAVVVVIIAFTKFRHGAWVVIVVIPILIFLMSKVKSHYMNVGKHLKVPADALKDGKIPNDKYTNHVIVPIESINRASLRALKYARSVSDNIIAFNVSIDEEHGKKVKERFELLNTGIPIIVKYSPYRKIVGPLIEFIQSEEYGITKGNIITVVIPEFIVEKWWQRLLHNQTGKYLGRQLLKHKGIVIATIPLQLKEKLPEYHN